MVLREKAEEIFAWGMKHREENCPDSNISAWENHSRGAAEVAEKIAERAGLDPDKAYACGLLHDMGRYKGPHTGLKHISDGYDILIEKGFPEDIARICMTHSFNPKESVKSLELDDKDAEQRIKDYVLATEYDDYDRLVQLADYMSGAHGVSTIERRYCSVMRRHGMTHPREILNQIYELKRYFDEKCGIDIYELFHDKIAETPFQGIPGGLIKDLTKKGEQK